MVLCSIESPEEARLRRKREEEMRLTEILRRTEEYVLSLSHSHSLSLCLSHSLSLSLSHSSQGEDKRYTSQSTPLRQGIDKSLSHDALLP